MNARPATLIGLLAILLWATLAPLTVLAAGVPPFQLVAMSFTIGALMGGIYLAARPSARSGIGRVTPLAALLGISGLLGYHVFYFLGLSLAPPLEANLVNYLWPLLIVLFSALLPDRVTPLRAHHLLGAAMAFCGAVLAITKGQALPTLAPGALAGYCASLLAAVIWAGYSVLSRRFAFVPSSAVALYCAATAIAAAIAHMSWETTVWPSGPLQWLALAGMGIGPVGLAFYVWDYGCKHGDIRVLGASAYFAPLVSTMLLIAFGLGEGSPVLWIAAIAITAGALIASKEFLIAPRDTAGRKA